MKTYLKDIQKTRSINFHKLLLIAFFIAAGCIVSVLPENNNNLDQSSVIEMKNNYLDENSIESILSHKEKNCNYKIEKSVDGDISKNLTKIYKSFRITVSKIIAT